MSFSASKSLLIVKLNCYKIANYLMFIIRTDKKIQLMHLSSLAII